MVSEFHISDMNLTMCMENNLNSSILKPLRESCVSKLVPFRLNATLSMGDVTNWKVYGTNIPNGIYPEKSSVNFLQHVTHSSV